MRTLLPLSLVALVACGRPDTPPTLEIRSPTADMEYDGYARFDVRLAIEDESNDPVEVEVLIDGELAGTAEGEKCRNGCSVEVSASTEGVMDGHHLLTAAVTDSNGNRVEILEEDAVVFSVFDVPYVDTLAVTNTRENLLDGPDIEVEVHILDDESALYRGCAALPIVQEDDLPYEDLAAPFVYTAAGGVLRYMDIAFTPVRFVVIESDGGEHCPSVPDLTDLLEDDVDQVYGVSVSQDLSVLFNNESLVISNRDFNGLAIKKGRPVNAD